VSEPVALDDAAAALDLGPHELVSLVGGGGKTTLLFRLGEQLAGRVVMTTTTKMGSDRTHDRPLLLSPGDPDLDAALAEHGRVLVWGAVEDHKAIGIPAEVVDAWFDRPGVDHVVVEADGSRRKPFKAPAPHEPVVPARSTIVVACVGVSALGTPIAEQSQRPELVARLLGCTEDDELTPERAATVLASPAGGRRNVPAGARFAVVVNRVAEPTAPAARALAAALAERGVDCLLVADEGD
jgi:probable selenium-dependent hydroxylase accessory protein YqeC